MNTALDSVLSKAENALDTLHAVSEALSAIRVTRRSDDAPVTVTVDGSGALTDLELAPDLSRESAPRLANAIVVTASEAAREALERHVSILAQMQSSLSET